MKKNQTINRSSRTFRPAAVLVVALALFIGLGASSRADLPASPTGSRIAVANRQNSTLSLIDVDREHTVQLDFDIGSEPMYAQSPFFSDEIWVGDRSSDRVLVFDALRLRQIAEVPTGRGVFHMWSHHELGQMWVVNDIDKTMTIIALETKNVLATVPIPTDLAPQFKPHDITVTRDGAIVTLLADPPSPLGYLVKYSGTTFQEVGRLQVTGDPHIFHWGFPGSKAYVASQTGGKVLEVEPDTLYITAQLEIPGAHGIWANEEETHLYVTNVESTDGRNSIYTIDLSTFQLVPGSPVDAALPFPHNGMASLTNDKLFITHSNAGSELTSIYDLDANGLPLASRVIRTGLIPFGLMLIRDPLVSAPMP